MPNAIAAFPWVQCRELIEIGPVRILPYEHGRLPGNLPDATQTDIDAVLGAYANRPNHPVTRASLLEVGDWHTGVEVDAHVRTLFLTRQAIGFSALSKRSLFRGHFDYCNYDTYSLVVQRYQQGSNAGMFSFNTRRRDGSTGHMWSSDEFAFHRPNHVDGRAKFDLDRPLLEALLTLGDAAPALLEAMREFNSANTDSSDVPQHVELVMVKSAFEWLLEIDTSVGRFVEALGARLATVLGIPIAEGPLCDRWRTRWPKVQRPLEAWARDFCDVRGAAAHGSRDAATRFVWPGHTHLAFAAIFFPLVFKKRLADEGLFTLDDADRARLEGIEQLLMVDPFSADALKDEYSHPWAEFQTQALFRGYAARLYSE